MMKRSECSEKKENCENSGILRADSIKKVKEKKIKKIIFGERETIRNKTL